MYLTKLRNNQIQLIKFMEKGGYSKSYINQVKTELNRLFKYGNSYKSYQDYYQNLTQINIKNKELKSKKKSILTLIMNYDLYDKFPDRNNNKNKLINNSNYSKLNDDFKSIIDTYAKEAKRKGKKDTTIKNETLNCSCFLAYLQSKGYKNICNVTEEDVLNFFVNEQRNLKYSHSYEKNIKIVLKECVTCENIIKLFPNIRYIRKNIDYLNEEEINKIKNILDSDNTKVTLRDKAIVSLLLYTGLRSCDVVNLKLSDINWEKEIISITQSKTSIPLELPLTTSVGNAIFKYIKYERAKVDINNIFLRSDVNYPITKNSAEIAVRNILREANVRQSDKKRKGTHIFRYNIATSLLKNEIPQPIISQVLGHESSKSLKFYLSTDFYHLKQCSLNIECFENIEEVNYD